MKHSTPQGYGDHVGSEAIVFAFNDAPRRSYRQIAAMIRVVKALAEADARARPDQEFATPKRRVAELT
jgi:hypothetical protein